MSIAKILAIVIGCHLTLNTPLRADEDRREMYIIGAVLPLSGPMAFAGTEARDAMILAAEELESGSSSYRYRIVFEDSALEPARTAAAAHKLINQDRVDAVVSLWPEAANIIAPITESKGVLHYTIAWDPAIACGRRLVLSHQAMVGDYARATLELLRAHKIKKPAFFHDSVFQLGADSLIQLAPEYGVTVTDRFTFDRGKADFRTEIAKAKKSASDGLLIWSIQPETDQFLRQVRDLKVQKFVSGFFDVVQDLRLIEGRSFPSEVYATPSFQEQFKKRFGRPAVMKGPNAYDVIKLLATAREKTGGSHADPAVLKSELTKIRHYPGAVGPVSVDSCGNSSYPIVIKRVKNGSLILEK